MMGDAAGRPRDAVTKVATGQRFNKIAKTAFGRRHVPSGA